MMNCKEDSTGRVTVDIPTVQITDLEDSVLLGPGKGVKGAMCGNENWRSPESWARAKQSLPSDVYSFAILVRSSLSFVWFM